MHQISNIVGGNVEIRLGAHRKFNEGGIRISDLPLFVWILPNPDLNFIAKFGKFSVLCCCLSSKYLVVLVIYKSNLCNVVVFDKKGDNLKV